MEGLKESQQEAADKIMQFFREGQTRVVLIGMAGTGKTFLTAHLMRNFIKDKTINKNYNKGIVYATAPTNKALAVLRSKIDVNAQFSTIHSALKLNRWIDPKTGEAKFFKNNKKDDPFRYAKVAAIDETSMLNSVIEGGNDPKTGEYIPGYLDDYRFPILYVGDDHQINPIGEECSPVFTKGYPTVELTEIIRQGEGNPIIDLSRDVDLINFKSPHLVGSKGYYYDDNVAEIVSSLADVNGTDEYKYLAYTNNAVDLMNNTVRKRLYGEKPRRIELGETIVFNSPHGEFYTNKEIKVVDAYIVTDDISIPTGETIFDSHNQPTKGEMDKIRIKYYRVNDQFNVVHEDSLEVHKMITNLIDNNCKKLGWNYRGKYYFAENFADITYNHALTIHKSQGSTYKNTVMNVGDIMINRKANERTRLLYTAITRASDTLILNNVK